MRIMEATDRKCCICWDKDKYLDKQYYMTANEWVSWKVNIEREQLTPTMRRVQQYGNEFPNKRFCPNCFKNLCQIFE